MTDIEQKALALVKRLRIIPDQNGLMYEDYEDVMQAADLIEQHEAFRQEVSDAVSKAIRFCKDGRPASAAGAIGAFVISAPKPDPLVDAMDDIGIGVYENIKTEYADTLRADLVRRFRAALDARGFEIREKNDGQPNSN